VDQPDFDISEVIARLWIGFVIGLLILAVIVSLWLNEVLLPSIGLVAFALITIWAVRKCKFA
jgi:uncharacterized membrane protein